MVAQRVVSPVFVGRGEELSALAAALDTAVEQGPAVALLAGEAGIGKSRLLAEFTRSLGPAVRVVGGVCAELGRDALPYAPLVTALRTLIRVEGVTPGPYRRLARWFPELGESGDGPEGGRHRLYEEVLALIERVAADRPLVISVEDLHWADAATCELLGFLVRNLTRPRVLLVLTHRPPGSGPLLSELARRPGTVRLRLDRFDEGDVGRQLTAILGTEPDPATVGRIHGRSDGNPLFVEALAHAEGRPGDGTRAVEAAPPLDGTGDSDAARTPEGARDLLLDGPRSLRSPARALLRLASVAGVRVGHRLLAEVAGRDGAELDVLLRELVDRSLLVAADDGYAFRHALIRDAVYEDLLPGERARLHARYAEALRDGAAPAELAAHAHAAGERGLARSAAYLAADRARRSYAYAEQVRLLGMVLDLWDADVRFDTDRIGVLTDAAEACMLSGDYARGIEYASAGLAAVDERREPERTALLLEHRGRLRHRLNATGVEDWERALELLPPGSSRRGRLLGVLAMGLLPEVDRARGPFEEALTIGRATDDALVTVRGLLGVGSLSGDLGMLAEARALAEHLDSNDLLLTVPMYEATLHTRAGDHSRAAEVADDGIRLARRYGLGRSRGAELARHTGSGLILAGRWDEAAAVLEESLRLDAPPQSRRGLRILAGRLSLLRGDLTAAAEAAAAVEHSEGGSLFARHQLLCLLAVAQGDPERADLLLERALSDPALTRIHSSDARQVLVAGALAQRARLSPRPGRELRERVAARQTQLAAADAALGVDGALDQAWQTMLRALVEDDGWDHAVTAWRRLRQPYELALCLFHSAQARPAADDRSAATARLREAARLAEDLRAAPLARQIARLLRPGPAQEGLTQGLTQREQEVLRLLAEGLSNRQIAARLHISPSTAGVHVSHILTKLHAATRTEAAAIAFRDGLAGSGHGGG
ncbi:ATP-binding protein [Streptomyces qinglanensis]|uniref:ATP-binding protein n=1 Tax=Streptomyces qinglanensis TaxID=943816 RepID=UPI000941E309|nr:helix-turn-helix transcriptional regulator [Streptomyces qinglanensis]